MDIYEARVVNTRRAMAAGGLDLLVMYANDDYSLGTTSSAWYVSGFKPMGPHSAVLLPKDDDPTLILTPAWDQARAEKRSAIKRVIATNDFKSEFGRVVQEQGLSIARTGIVGEPKLSRSTRAFVNSQFRVALAPFDETFGQVARVRDALELNLSARAAEVAERGYEHLLKVVRPGMLEYELAAEVDWYMKSHGADDNFQLISASQHNPAVRVPGDRRLDVGDVILGEISPSVSGQFVQICRTAVIGPVTDLQREKYQLLIDAMRAGIRAGVPGARVREVVESINAVVRAAGYGKYCVPPYMRARGHATGLGSSAPGQLTPDNDMVLEAGMTFVIHPNQYVPETGYFLVGEPVVVTETGLRPLTSKQPAIDCIPV